MEYFIKNRNYIEEFGQNANMLVNRIYNGDRIAQDIEKIYTKIVKET